MSQSQYQQNCIILASLMEQAALKNLEELSQTAGISGLQLRRLQYGLIHQLSVETAIKLAKALQISLEQLLFLFTEPIKSSPIQSLVNSDTKSPQLWQQEYQQLEQEMAQQAKTLQTQFQQASINVIESWLIQWPTAVAAIQKNPDLPAERLIPLVKPVKELVETWGITAISHVGEELAYDPQWHELMNGVAEPGTKVKVRYVGYKQQDKILYKAKVSPVDPSL